MGKTSSIVKIVVGLVLIAGGIAWYFVRIPGLSDVVVSGLVPFWKSFIMIIAGLLGVVVFLGGLLLTWMGYDGYKSA